MLQFGQLGLLCPTTPQVIMGQRILSTVGSADEVSKWTDLFNIELLCVSVYGICDKQSVRTNQALECPP